MATRSAHAPSRDISPVPKTRSPVLKPWAAGPASTTTPANSQPRVPPEKSLAGIDADRANLDQHVRVTESRFRHLDELHGEIFDAMGLFVHKRLHSANLSVKVSRTAASGPPSC